jgi:hypothetical protein
LISAVLRVARTQRVNDNLSKRRDFSGNRVRGATMCRQDATKSQHLFGM